MRKTVWLALSLAVLFLAPAVLCQEAQKNNDASPRTGCGSDTCITRVMSLPDATPSELQDVVNTLRQTLDIGRITPNPSEHSISFQGTREQIAVAERIVSVLENLKLSGGKNRASVLVYQPDPSVPEPEVSETASAQSPTAAHWAHCEVTTCFIKALYLPDYSIGQLQEVVNRLHSNANVVRIQIVLSSHAIVFQGTSEQLVVAEKLIKE